MPAGRVIGDLPQGDLSMTEETTSEPYDAGGTGEQRSKRARTDKGGPIVIGGLHGPTAFVAVVRILLMAHSATAVANLIPYTAEAVLLIAVLAHVVDAIRLICPPVRVKSNRKPTKQPNLVMPTTMTPSMTIAKASAMPQTCLVVPTLVS